MICMKHDVVMIKLNGVDGEPATYFCPDCNREKLRQDESETAVGSKDIAVKISNRHKVTYPKIQTNKMEEMRSYLDDSRKELSI